MRVVHFYGGNLYGGVERLLVVLAEYARFAPGLEQEFALCYRGRLAEELEAQGTGIHWLGRVRVSRPWQVAAARRRVRQWLRQQPCDVAICHAWWPYAIFGPAARAAGIPVALWVHDTATGRGWLQRWAGRHRPDLLITYSRNIRSSLPRLFPGMSSHALAPPVPMPEGVSAAERAALRAELGVRADQSVILQVSRMEEWKGHGRLLDALAPLREREDWTAWIAGGAQRPKERTYLQSLRERATTLGLDGRIRWLGERRDVARLMASADIFCQPNTGPEPFGIVFVEALASGLPVVTTASGGGVDIVTPACGRLTEPNAEAVSRALLELLDNRELRLSLAAQAPARARALCDPATQMQRLYAILNLVAGSHAGGVAASPAPMAPMERAE